MKEAVPNPLKIKITGSFPAQVSFLGFYQQTLLPFPGDRYTYCLYVLFSLLPLNCILRDHALLSTHICENQCKILPHQHNIFFAFNLRR